MNDIAMLAKHDALPSDQSGHAQARLNLWFDLLGQRRSSP